jgi:hypothetical protein
MPRLRDTRTGVVVSVDDDTAAVLGAAYEPVTEKAPAKRSASSKTQK